MKIAIIGTGYVGLTSSAVFAHLGHQVFALDKNEEKIKSLKRGEIPFFEPDLEKLLKEGLKNKLLIPTTNYKEAVSCAEIIFICVGTPTKENGEPDLSQVFAAGEKISKYIMKNAVIVNKSTVPTGTTEKMKLLIKEKTDKKFFVASCPEFLREGSAVKNTLHPDRIIIGTDSKFAQEALLNCHKKLPGEKVTTNIRTAEMIKYASNAFLATKISFINEIANLCEEVGANVDDVALGMGLDPRIGKDFLKAGIGYGGSCFPKDTKALHFMAASKAYNFKLLKAVIEVNKTQRRKFIGKVRHILKNLKGKRLGVLGLAFKNNTDDVRESASIDIIKWLMDEGAHVFAYDPKAMANAKVILPKLQICKSAEEVSKNSDAILILTEWQEFKTLDWHKIKKQMKNSIIFDGRNLLELQKMKQIGFTYVSIGRP